MPFRKSKATKAKETVTDQVSDRTDDLVAALDAAKASEAADKLMPERAKQRRREAARRRNRQLLAGAGLTLLVGVAFSRLAGSKADKTGGWERAPEPARDADPVASPAEVTQLHGNGAGGDPARTPPS
jgi:hypothetical protein